MKRGILSGKKNENRLLLLGIVKVISFYNLVEGPCIYIKAIFMTISTAKIVLSNKIIKN